MNIYLTVSRKISKCILLTFLSLVVTISAVANTDRVSGLSCSSDSEPLSPSKNIRANQYVFRGEVGSAQDDDNATNRTYTIRVLEAIKGVEIGQPYTITTDSTWGSQLSQGEQFIGIFNTVNHSTNPPSFAQGLCETDPTIINSNNKPFFTEYEEAITQYKADPSPLGSDAVNLQPIIAYASGFAAMTVIVVLVIFKRKNIESKR